MLQHLVILLDDTSVAYCHRSNPIETKKLIPLEMLKKGILFGMKENLMIQFVYPDYDLPQEFLDEINAIDSVSIKPISASNANIYVANKIEDISENKKIVALRLDFKTLLEKQDQISALLNKVERINLVITDVQSFNDGYVDLYKILLEQWTLKIIDSYKQNNKVQLNVLTDRLIWNKMNNCEAGVENITLAPNGKFYLCPAFYYDECMGVDDRMNHKNPTHNYSVGDLDVGLHIPNEQLLQLDHAPLCRECDAYHCHRCLWCNNKLTMDINTPSRQQCMIAHLERNASRLLQQKLKGIGLNLEMQSEIKEIDYLDPFDKKQKL